MGNLETRHDGVEETPVTDLSQRSNLLVHDPVEAERIFKELDALTKMLTDFAVGGPLMKQLKDEFDAVVAERAKSGEQVERREDIRKRVLSELEESAASKGKPLDDVTKNKVAALFKGEPISEEKFLEGEAKAIIRRFVPGWFDTVVRNVREQGSQALDEGLMVVGWPYSEERYAAMVLAGLKAKVAANPDGVEVSAGVVVKKKADGTYIAEAVK